MADFSVNDKFDPSKGYTGVRFGADAPLLEVELNEMQKIQAEARAEIVRKTAHSGVLDYVGSISNTINVSSNVKGEVQVPKVTNSETYRNNKLIVTKFNALVNGHIFEVNKTNDLYANVINLPEPPTEGERDDFVFLEAWFEEIDSVKDPSIKDARIGEETSRRTKLNYRIRTVAGVDFTKFPEGFTLDTSAVGGTNYNDLALAQGANDSPLVYDGQTFNVRFSNSKQRVANGKTSGFSQIEDVGLYVAGMGTQTSKDLLKTVDGYVYAIPMFRVKRRNSGGYSQNNGNGSRNFETHAINLLFTNSVAGLTQVEAILTDTSKPPIVGEIYSDREFRFRVDKVEGDKVTLTTLFDRNRFGSWTILQRESDRPDGKYANVIHQDDIIDLRHKVSLTGFNLQQLMEENFDKLLRGELRTKEGQKLLKTYHGVPKTPIDSNTVFYASLDGTPIPERGTLVSSGEVMDFKPSITGLGMTSRGINTFELASQPTGKFITIDLIVQEMFTTNFQPSLLTIRKKEDTSKYFSMSSFPNASRIDRFGDISKPTHLRAVLDLESGVTRAYRNGKLVESFTNSIITNLKGGGLELVLNGNANGSTYMNKFLVSDLSISNIDRGDVFPTLPKDFIDGYARIDKAFNGQRRNFSDAQNAQHTTSIAKPKSQVSDRGITVAKGTGTNETIWETGDTIKVKGVGGEVIMGAVDTDTALARVISFADGKVSYTESTTPKSLKLDSVSGINVGDTIVVGNYNGANPTNAVVEGVDTTNKVISLNVIPPSSGIHAFYVFETTQNTSSPVTKFGDGETVKTVEGTWTNLGTNEATFTLGENVNLDTEEIFIEYSLVSPNGQGGIPEVLTEVLEGQYLGQKYVKGAPVIKADFRAKVSGSVVENPHKFFTGKGTQLLAPKYFTSEIGNTVVNGNVHILDNKSVSSSFNVSGEIAQQLFSFDLIAEVERQFGRIPKATKAEKIQWLKDNLNRTLANWYGYGANPTGNKATLTLWRHSSNGYVSGNSSTLTTVSKIPHSNGSAPVSEYIDDSGFIHFLAYAEQSDGVTPSAINTDYVELEIEFKTLTGYDALTPEEPFHNGTQKNLFFIRKETKEIEMMFNCDEDYGVVTWGNYIPKQQIPMPSEGFIFSVFDKAYLTTHGTGMPRGNIYLPKINMLLDSSHNYVDDFVSFNAIDDKTTNQFALGIFVPVRHGGNGYSTKMSSGKYVSAYLYPKDISQVLPSGKALAIIPGLFEHQGNIYLVLIADEVSPTASTNNLKTTYLFDLEGRPLVKGV